MGYRPSAGGLRALTYMGLLTQGERLSQIVEAGKLAYIGFWVQGACHPVLNPLMY